MLPRLQFRRRARGRGRGQIVLDAANADDARPLAKIGGHDPNASTSAATESAKATRSFGVWRMKASRSGRRAIASSIIGSPPADRKSVGSGKSVSVRVDLGGRRIIKKKKKENKRHK